MNARILFLHMALATSLVAVISCWGSHGFANADEPNTSSSKLGDPQNLGELVEKLRGLADSTKSINSDDIRKQIAITKNIDIVNRGEQPEGYSTQRDLKFTCLALLLVTVDNRIDPLFDPNNPQEHSIPIAPSGADFQRGIPLRIGADPSNFKNPESRRIHEDFSKRNADSGRGSSFQWDLHKLRNELVSREIFPFVKLNYINDNKRDTEDLERVMVEEIHSVKLRGWLQENLRELDKMYHVRDSGRLVRKASSSP